MKNIISFLLLFCITLTNAQKVSDYKYVSVPLKFSDFDANQYSLNSQLKILLKKKDYEPLGGNKDYWPTAAKLNPCRVLTADLLDVSSFFKNKLKLVFKDCNNTIVFEEEATSDIKAFDKGFADALQQLAQHIDISSAQDSAVDPVANEVTIVTKTTQAPKYQRMLPDNKKTKPTTTTKVIERNNIPLNNSTDIVITALDNGEYMVLDAKKSVVLAHYYPAAKDGVYHVKISTPNGTDYYTIGYVGQDGKLSYEQTSDFQTWKLTTFN